MLSVRVLLVVVGLSLLESSLCIVCTPTGLLRPAARSLPLRRIRADGPWLSQLPQVDDDEEDYGNESPSLRSGQTSLGFSDVALRSMLTLGLLCAARLQTSRPPPCALLSIAKFVPERVRTLRAACPPSSSSRC